MINNKLISIKRIIAKIYSDLGVDEENIPVTDIIEWSADALEKIEAPLILTDKVTGKEGIPLTPIYNYQAELPMDCVHVNQVAYAKDVDSTNFYPMKYASGTFSKNHGLTSQMSNEYYDSSKLDDISSYNDITRLAMDLYNIDYDTAVEKINNEPDTRSILNSLLSTDQGTVTSDGNTIGDKLEYSIVPGYIKTNAKEGYLMISYKAMPTDEDGFPMIPDHTSFINAVYWFVASKISYINWRSDPNNANHAIYQHDASKWNFYVKQAYGKAMMPTNIDELESIKNQWNRLMPKVNEGKSFFKDLNEPENLVNHTRVG